MIETSKCDVICLSETHLTGSNEITIEGFKWFGYNRQSVHLRAPKGSGGVGIFVKDTVLENFNVHVVDKCYEGIIALSFMHKVSEFSLIIFS